MLCESPKLTIRVNNKIRLLTSKEINMIHDNKITLMVDSINQEETTYQVLKIPCEKCALCRYKNCGEWAVRCWLESTLYDHNFFYTLTYDSDNIPKNGVSKKELSKFMHDLRQHFQRNHKHVGIRFFGCGGYGIKHKRPHYHVLVFNCPYFGDENSYRPTHETIEDDTTQHYVLLRSTTLDNIWGKGICTIGLISPYSAFYVARHALSQIYSLLPKDVNPPFINMSRNKGIGADYVYKNLEQLINDDSIHLPNGKSARLPHYFEKLIKQSIGCERYEQEVAKPRAERAKAYMAEEMARTGLSKEELIKLHTERAMEILRHLEKYFLDIDEDVKETNYEQL